MLVNGFVNVGISSLEKRFGFKSSQTSVIAVGYDIAFCVCTLFVTYFFSRSHRPRLVGIGCLTMGLGAVVFTLPHFTTGNYEYSDDFTGSYAARVAALSVCETQKNLNVKHTRLFTLIVF